MTTTSTNQPPSSQSRTWMKSELDSMSQADMEKNLDEVQAAITEGRVDWDR